MSALTVSHQAWRDMKPQQRDELVAKHVLGWAQMDDGAWRKPDGFVCLALPWFSLNNDCANTLVRVVAAQRKWCVLTANYGGKRVACRVNRLCGDFIAEEYGGARGLPEVICRALLTAAGVLN
jgi:hypothetical protein